MSLKIGFIGVGGIAQQHIKELRRIEDAEIVAVFDVNRDNAVKTAELTGAEVMDNADQLLNPARIDAAYICVPQFARDNLEVIAALRGIHLFVEKPLGLDIEAVRAKEKIIRDSGIVHSVGYCLRYLDTVQKAKAYLADKQAHLIQAYRFGGYHPAHWWHQLEMSGGHMVDAVTHQVDMIRYVAGEFREVHANYARLSFDRVKPDGTIYDAGAISFSMENGTVGTITESCLSLHHSGTDVKLFGPDFFVNISNNGFDLTIIDNERNETVTSLVEPYLEQAKTFVKAVRYHSQEGILSDYEDGLKTLAVTLATNRSVEKGTAIRV